jgi:hypothetical protein
MGHIQVGKLLQSERILWCTRSRLIQLGIIFRCLDESHMRGKGGVGRGEASQINSGRTKSERHFSVVPSRIIISNSPNSDVSPLILTLSGIPCFRQSIKSVITPSLILFEILLDGSFQARLIFQHVPQRLPNAPCAWDLQRPKRRHRLGPAQRRGKRM